ncbi:MAG: RNA methyltransferase [Thermodesulfobacteriota bacterium]
MRLQQLHVVLVEPQGAANVGSVARAMMNFGFTSLRLVRPRVDHRAPAARHMAVSAADLLAGAEIHDSLASALADCHFSMGTTRRFGKYRQDLLLPRQAGEAVAGLADGTVAALVFGREDSGLTTAELDQCQQLITIPTLPALPSMNLAQAVTVLLYEASLALQTPSMPARREMAATHEEVEAMFAHMRQTLLDAEFLDPQNPDHLLHAFRRMFGRAGLGEREVRILHGLWSRIDWLNSKRAGNGPA